MPLRLATSSFSAVLPCPWPCRAIVTAAEAGKIATAVTDIEPLGTYLGETQIALSWVGTAPIVLPAQPPDFDVLPCYGWAEWWPGIVPALTGLSHQSESHGWSSPRPRVLAASASYPGNSATTIYRREPVDYAGTPLGTWHTLVTLYRARKLARVVGWLNFENWPLDRRIDTLAVQIMANIGEAYRIVPVTGKGTVEVPGDTVRGSNRVFLVSRIGDAPEVRNLGEFVSMTHLQPACPLTLPYSDSQRNYIAANPNEFDAVLDPDNLANLKSAMKETWKSAALSAEFYIVGRNPNDRFGYAAMPVEQIQELVDHPPLFIPERVATKAELLLITRLKNHTIDKQIEYTSPTSPRSLSPYLPTCIPDQEGGRLPPSYRFGNVLVHYWPSQILSFAIWNGDRPLLRFARQLVDEMLNCWWRHDSKFFRRGNYPFMGSGVKFLEDPSAFLLASKYFGDRRAGSAWQDYWAVVSSQPQREFVYRAIDQQLVNHLIALESNSLPGGVVRLVEAAASALLTTLLATPFDPTAVNPAIGGVDSTQFWDGRLPLLLPIVERHFGAVQKDRLLGWLMAMHRSPKRDACGHDPIHRLGLLPLTATEPGAITEQFSNLRRFSAQRNGFYHYTFLSHAFGLWPPVFRRLAGNPEFDAECAK